MRTHLHLKHRENIIRVTEFHDTVTCHSDQETGFGFVISSINNLQAVTTNNYYTITDFYTFQYTAAHALRFSVCTSRILATDLNIEISISNL
jgi:hypothetical protein